MVNNFKPITVYNIDEDSLLFAMKLAKIGHVHILSNQIQLTQFKSSMNHISLSFIEYGTEHNNCEGMQLPKNWIIEHIQADNNSLSITFKILKTN